MSTMLPKVEKFEHIECESLLVGSKEGNAISLSTYDGIPQIVISVKEQPLVVLAGDPDNNGVIHISGPDGQPLIKLFVDENSVGRVVWGTSKERFSPKIPWID